MEYVTAVLLVLSLLLLVLYMMLRNKLKKLEKEFDEFTIHQLQELYQIKSKLKILKEELLMDVDSQYPPSGGEKTEDVQGDEVHAIIKNQILALAGQGLSIGQIAKQSSLPEEQVRMVLKENEGGRYE